MNGLIYKDFMLLKRQGRFFITFAAIAIIMQAVMDNSNFVMGYLTICGTTMVLNTISFDEYDNGNAFLFSLPITRKSYVMEKFAFAFITGGTTWLVSLILAVIFNMIKPGTSMKETFLAAPAYLAVMIIILSLILPVRLKFGGEKMMYVFMGIGGTTMIIGVILRLIEIDFSATIKFFSDISIGGLLAGLAVIAVLGLAVSYKISIGVMNKKEF